jgi:hypothetical protein
MDQITANWSAVAGEAFEQHLKRHKENQEAPMSDDDAIQRLRRLKAAGEAGARLAEPGYDAGRQWAMTDAHPGELERLEGYFARQLEPGGRLPGNVDDRLTFMQQVHDIAAAVLNVPAGPMSQNRWKEFWKERSGLDPSTRPTPAAIYAFCQGAVEFWRKVKDKV